jgi:hypothetical protein
VQASAGKVSLKADVSPSSDLPLAMAMGSSAVLRLDPCLGPAKCGGTGR